MEEYSGDYGNDFVVLTDEEGNEIELEHLDTLEENGETYFAFVDSETNLDDPGELIVLKSIKDEAGEEMLITVDDHDEYDKIFDMFSERLENTFEDEEEEPEEEN